MDYFKFLHRPDFLPPCTLTSNQCIKNKFTKNFYLLKVTTFHGESVKNESARGKNRGGGAPNANLSFYKPLDTLNLFMFISCNSNKPYNNN